MAGRAGAIHHVAGTGNLPVPARTTACRPAATMRGWASRRSLPSLSCRSMHPCLVPLLPLRNASEALGRRKGEKLSWDCTERIQD
jgi:hypothetical protein